jgi:hypothetical protein
VKTSNGNAITQNELGNPKFFWWNIGLKWIGQKAKEKKK